MCWISSEWLLFDREVDAAKRHCCDSARHLRSVGYRRHVNPRHNNRVTNLKRAGARDQQAARRRRRKEADLQVDGYREPAGRDRRGHRTARGPVSPEILAGQPLIVRVHCEQLQSASRILDAWKVRPRIVAQTDSDARALAMVAAGLGFCLMPDSFEHPEVRMLRPEGVDLPRRLGFEWIKGGADGWLDRALDRL